MTNTYEGRPLPRPDAHIEDQGLGFDLVTVGRRNLLRAFGLGAAAVAGLAACSDSGGSATTAEATAGATTGATTGTTTGTATASAEIPDETAGPYPGDGSNGPNVLTQSGIVRSDIRSSFGGSTGTAEGVPMTLELSIVDLAGGGGAFAGVAVYVWHCDRAGRYSLYSQAVTDQNYLRGVQIADDTGKVRFTSIFPAAYDGRWPHIHFEVYRNQDAVAAASNAIATSQVALPKATCETVYKESGYEASVTNLARVSLQNDNVFGDDGAAHQLGTATGSVAGGYTVTLTVPVDTRTTPVRGAVPGSR